MFTLPQPTEWIAALTCRRAMLVRELMVFEIRQRTDSYYVCPRCRITMDREFMGYCDRCGLILPAVRVGIVTGINRYDRMILRWNTTASTRHCGVSFGNSSILSIVPQIYIKKLQLVFAPR